MSITIKGKIRDILSFVRHLKIRYRKFNDASTINKEAPFINKLSESLHPAVQNMVIKDIIVRADGIKSYRLKRIDNKKPAHFRAGQYIVIESDIDGVYLSRPYSISCSPEDCYNSSYYEITIKKEIDGYLSSYSNDKWEIGKELIVSEPMGQFYYEPLRDKKDLLFFAGGSGITPFRSLIPSLLFEHPEIKITLFYGFPNLDEYLFKDDFLDLSEKSSGRFKIIPVPMEADGKWKGAKGFINESLIKSNVENLKTSSWFICGPQPMKVAIKSIATSIGIDEYTIRQESFTPDKSNKAIEKKVKIIVHLNSTKTIIEASTDKTIIYSLERAGLNPPAYCRSGECGWCRSKLIAGSVDVPDSVTGVREADNKFGYIHPCSSYPLTDIEIELPPNPLSK